jgi:hypothetical protein
MSCSAPTVTVGGVSLSTSSYENAKQLINAVGTDQSDPTADEYEGYIANGNNTNGIAGIQSPLPTQTTLPPEINEPAKKENTKPPPSNSVTGSSAPTWDGSDYDFQLSPNFKLRYFTVGGGTGASVNATYGPMFPHQLIDVTGYTKQVRFSNLYNLANKICEPLYSKFGQFRINSGIRNENSVQAPGVSQHVTGEACDIQFSGWTYDTYWQNSQWIKDNIPYDQFIFEHSSKSKTVWLHLSFKSTGGRAASDRTKVMTMYQGKYDSGLKKYY